jgi:hypothetical protein
MTAILWRRFCGGDSYKALFAEISTGQMQKHVMKVWRLEFEVFYAYSGLSQSFHPAG